MQRGDGPYTLPLLPLRLGAGNGIAVSIARFVSHKNAVLEQGSSTAFG